jgi:hypothetical protein
MHSYSKQDTELDNALRAHREEEFARKREKIRIAYDQANPTEPLGPTPRFPEGHLTPADEGELRFQIGVVNGAVVLNFGAPTQAIGFNPRQALDLADLLRKHAKALAPDKKRNHGGRGGGK